MSSSMIVNHLLNKNANFICIKKEQVLDTINPERMPERNPRLIDRKPDIEVMDFDGNQPKGVNDFPLHLSSIDKTTSVYRVNSQGQLAMFGRGGSSNTVLNFAKQQKRASVLEQQQQDALNPRVAANARESDGYVLIPQNMLSQRVMRDIEMAMKMAEIQDGGQ